jgi:hypothetical protein
LLESAEVRESGAKTMLVSSATKTGLVEHYARLLPKTVILSKPLNVVKCERAIHSLSTIFESRVS